jgi:hypothetical protein
MILFGSGKQPIHTDQKSRATSGSFWGLKPNSLLDENSTLIASDKIFDSDPQMPDQSFNLRKRLIL